MFHPVPCWHERWGVFSKSSHCHIRLQLYSTEMGETIKRNATFSGMFSQIFPSAETIYIIKNKFQRNNFWNLHVSMCAPPLLDWPLVNDNIYYWQKDSILHGWTSHIFFIHVYQQQLYVHLSVSLLILDKHSKANFFILKFLDTYMHSSLIPFESKWSQIKFRKIVSVCIKCNANQKFENICYSKWSILKKSKFSWNLKVKGAGESPPTY